MNVDGKIAVITGASSGLGAALANALVMKGAIVYGLARNIEKLQAIKNKLGEKFIPVGMDITNAKDISSWVVNTFPGPHFPDMLINNAGTGYFTKIDELSLERWHKMINIGSILGKTTRTESAAYSATKYGMQGFSEALFKELRSYKIKVTCVNPGSIDTAFFEDSGIQPHKNMLQPKDIATLIIQIVETPDNFLVDEITMRPLILNPPA